MQEKNENLHCLDLNLLYFIRGEKKVFPRGQWDGERFFSLRTILVQLS